MAEFVQGARLHASGHLADYPEEDGIAGFGQTILSYCATRRPCGDPADPTAAASCGCLSCSREFEEAEVDGADTEELTQESPSAAASTEAREEQTPSAADEPSLTGPPLAPPSSLLRLYSPLASPTPPAAVSPPTVSLESLELLGPPPANLPAAPAVPKVSSAHPPQPPLPLLLAASAVLGMLLTVILVCGYRLVHGLAGVGSGRGAGGPAGTPLPVEPPEDECFDEEAVGEEEEEGVGEEGQALSGKQSGAACGACDGKHERISALGRRAGRFGSREEAHQLLRTLAGRR